MGGNDDSGTVHILTGRPRGRDLGPGACFYSPRKAEQDAMAKFPTFYLVGLGARSEPFRAPSGDQEGRGVRGWEMRQNEREM